MKKTFSSIAKSAQTATWAHDAAVAKLHQRLGRAALNLVQQDEPEIYKALQTLYAGNPTNMAAFLMTRQPMFEFQKPIDLLANGKADDIRAKLCAAKSGNQL